MFSGMKKWTKILFLVSLALNFIVIGTFAGHRLGIWKKFHHHGMSHHILKIMPENKRPDVEKILTSYKQTHPHKRGKFIRNWPQFDTLLRAESFDRAAFLAAFSNEITRHNQRWVDGGKTIADIAELLTPQERVEVLDKLKKKWERRRHYRRRHAH